MSLLKRKNSSDESEQMFAVDLTTQNPDLEPFPDPFYEDDYNEGCTPKTLIELDMMRLSGAIRSKSKWYEKMNNETIRNKWKQEALEKELLSVKQIDYVLAELEYYNSIRDDSMEMSAVDGVWQSDELIPIHLKESLIEGIKDLEDVPEREKDWHPGTNKQILDLVHPSLFCYVYQMTRIINDKNRTINVDNALEYIEDGQIIDINATTLSGKNKLQKVSVDYTRSDAYQWLPAEFNVSKDGQVTIESYINNLHPTENKDLYQLIERIFQHFIPLFNEVLTDLFHGLADHNRITVYLSEWYRDFDKPDSDSNASDDDDAEQMKLPDVGEFQMPSFRNSSIDLRGRKLQVIVKLANIVLTPENPKYPGGVWHVEGMENEHIVSTGIFYFFNSNITQSDLQFRTKISEPHYEENRENVHSLIRNIYGLSGGGSLNQVLGEVITQENRCIAFPNIYQHRVAPFELKDPTQPGQRKILVFFLVDPSVRILSTANVPPQQSHWYINVIRSIHPFNTLPSIVVDKIMNYIDCPMTMNQAKEHREKLMKERKYFIQQNTELMFERPFSLCEH